LRRRAPRELHRLLVVVVIVGRVVVIVVPVVVAEVVVLRVADRRLRAQSRAPVVASAHGRDPRSDERRHFAQGGGMRSTCPG